MDSQLSERVDMCVQRLGGQIKASMVTGIPKSTLSRWSQADGPDVPSQGIRVLAEHARVSVDWLVTGRGSPDASGAGFHAVPLYDVRLAAGVANFTDAAKVVAMVPIDADLLRQIGRSNADGLGYAISDGDSMWPTIQDGSRVLLDLRDTRLREGIFGFRQGNNLRIKRLRQLGDDIEIRSDNERYPPEIVRMTDEADHDGFQIIGRAKIAETIL